MGCRRLWLHPDFIFRAVRCRDKSGECRIFYSYRKRIGEERDERGRNQGAKKGAGGAGHRPPEEIECGGGPAPQFPPQKMQGNHKFQLQKVSNFNAKFGVRPNSSISKRFFSKSIFLKIPSGRTFHKNAKQPAGIDPPCSRESPQRLKERKGGRRF